MRKWLAALAFWGALGFGQVGTGTITGLITDPQGAAVPRAGVEARNLNTSAVYATVASSSGNYTVTQLPAGAYDLTVNAAGFKTAVRTALQVQATETIREDVALEVGSASETITVAAKSSLLRTETGELSYHFSGNDLDSMPLLGIGPQNAGNSGIRNPFNIAALMPGVDYVPNLNMIVNGTPNNSSSYRMEGQDMTNHIVNFALQEFQPGAGAIQEIAVQTSNFSAEYGAAGGSVFNLIMRSGANQFHGSGFEYFVNEDLNAAQPFSIDTAGNKYRPRNRRNDYGGTLGGPVWIPKLYNGRNRTFFFFSWEQYLESVALNIQDTLPVPAYRGGDFSHISPNGDCSLCSTYGIPKTALGTPTAATDALGRPFFANTIYDPLTRAVNPANLQGYANPFPNNRVDPTRFDPISAKIQPMFPAVQNANLTQNYAGFNLGVRTTTIPSLKIDQSITASDKLSFYWSTTGTEAQYSLPNGGADGLPVEISGARGTFIPTRTFRLNYDRSLSSTLLFHAGAGYQWLLFSDDAPFLNFNPAAFGFSGFQTNRNFPSFAGLLSATYGGMQNFGVSAQSHQYYQKPTYNANLTYVRGNHTYKTGAEAFLQGTITRLTSEVAFATGTGPTSQPFASPISFNGFTTGLGYASWLLGDYGLLAANGNYVGITQTPAQDYRQGKSQWAAFVQDSWKVTRRLTLDYGLRWDLGTAVKEQYGRVGELDPTAPNANAGGHPGATMYAARCGCPFYRGIYPYAIGPRIGMAYQLTPKTVLRGGWGLVYQFTADSGASPVAVPGIYPLSGINAFVNLQTPGAVPQPFWPTFDPSVYPTLGTLSPAPSNPDRNLNRPPRLNQYSFSIQREMSRNLILEVDYLGNHDVWIPGPLGFLSQLSPAAYAQFGLNPYTNYADFQLLSQPISSTIVRQKMAANGFGNGGLLLPYAGFPQGTPLKSALYPFPQFGALLPSGSPTGKSFYNALQIKATQRLWRGLQFNANYTWSKNEVLNARQDFFNPAGSATVLASTNQPNVFSFGVLYTTPRIAWNRWIGLAAGDWEMSAAATYASAFMLTPPASPTANLLSSEDYRVPGVPLYLKDLNCHCINPYTDQVLNPAAWQVVGVNRSGPAPGTYYGDFRGPRHPQENFNLGRNFRVKERYNLQVRAEFVNIFNRVFLGNPSTLRPDVTLLTRNGAGQLTAGFGTINATAAVNNYPALGGLPRTGTLVARFSF